MHKTFTFFSALSLLGVLLTFFGGIPYVIGLTLICATNVFIFLYSVRKWRQPPQTAKPLSSQDVDTT